MRSAPHSLSVILISETDDFFIGIGDINSSFLPKIEPLTPVLPGPSSLSQIAGGINDSTPDTAEGAKATAIDTTPTVPATPLEEEEAELQKTAMFSKNNAALDAQLEERPLAKKEKELQEHETTESAPEQAPTEVTKEPSPKPEKAHKKALLKNDDYELERIGKVGSMPHGSYMRNLHLPLAIERGSFKVL